MTAADDSFYRVFEERYRGSRELIKERQRAYLPFVEPLLAFYPGASAVDLGCGRGEWLEILGQVGFSARGVERDECIRTSCTDAGLLVEGGDAGAFLASLPDASQAVVSALHVVEHIRFDELRAWIQQAMRVLKPGGLLVLETPNPENILVATSDFYLDPTHQRPLPPELLAFVVEFHGFGRVHTVRLQERHELLGEARVGLRDVLGGPSPDYAIVAQKQGSDAIMHALDGVFAKEFGLTFEVLSRRYEDRLLGEENRLKDLAERVEGVTGGLDELARHLKGATAQWQQRTSAAEVSLRTLEGRIEELALRAQLWQTQAVGLQAERDALRSSWSWRLSAPLRWFGSAVNAGASTLCRRAGHAASGLTWDSLRVPLGGLMRIVLRYPDLSRRINRRLLRYPALYSRLVAIAHRQGIHSLARVAAAASAATSPVTRAVDGSGRERSALTGTERDVDELLLRIEDEVERWRSGEGR